MRSPNRLAVAGLGAVAAASALLAATTPLGNDYPGGGAGADDAGPQVDALIHGDLHRFFSEQSFLGPVSLVLRAPFAALAELGDGTLLGQYRLGVFPCVLALGLVALAVARLAAARGARAWHAAVLIGVLLFSGPAVNALRSGHPEEMLTAALVLAAALAAGTGRDGAAALLVGAAIASKPWAALALGPIAVASAAPVRTALLGAGTGLALLAPMVLADTDAFRAAARGANEIHRVRPLSLWWLPWHGDLPAAVDQAVRPALAGLSVLLALVARRRGRLALEPLLALLALVFLLRCVLDPGDNAYYHVPFLAALASWELLDRRRPPVLAFAGGLLLTARFLGELGTDNDLRSAVYLAWSLPLAGHLALALWRSYAAPRVAPA